MLKVPFDAGDRSVGLDLQQILLDMASHHIDDTSGERRRTQRIDPVSYTHLDVYKRQVL